MTEANAMTAKAIGGKDIIFKELTVADVRAISASTREFNLLNESLFEELSLADIPLFTSLQASDIEGMLPSDLQKVIDTCKERNPHFFKMLTRLSQGSKA